MSQKEDKKDPSAEHSAKPDELGKETNTKKTHVSKSKEDLFPQMPGHPFEASMYKEELRVINRQEEIKENQKKAKAHDEAKKKRLSDVSEKGRDDSKAKRHKMDTSRRESPSKSKRDRKSGKKEAEETPKSEDGSKKSSSTMPKKEGSATKDGNKKRTLEGTPHSSKKKGGKSEPLVDLQDPDILEKLEKICSLIPKAAKGGPSDDAKRDLPEPMTEVSI